MTYTINRTDGTKSIVIQDGTINRETTLTLVGRNYPGYGEILDQNFLKMLEHSSNANPPATPISGELWWDSTQKVLKAFTGLNWKSIGSTTSSYNKPAISSSLPGDLWWDIGTGQLWGYDNNTFDYKLIGPAGGAAGGVISEQLNDTLSNSHSVLSMKINGVTYLILSTDPTFTPNPAISGFQSISPGLNLANQSFLNNAQFLGTVSSSATLNGIDSNGFMRANVNTGTSGILSVRNNYGLYVGNNNDFHVFVTAPNVAVSNETNNGMINFKVRNSVGEQLDAMDIDATGNVNCNYNLNVTGSLNFPTNTPLILAGTTASTNIQTGILQSRGGAGISGNLNVGGTTSHFSGQVIVNSLFSNSFISASTLTLSSVANLGDVSHVKINGGTNGYYLKTDGSGNLSWSSLSASGIDITSLLPGQTGNANKFLLTDGAGGLSWGYSVTPATINNGLPNQTGNDGKFLTTDGTGNLQWQSIIQGANYTLPVATGSVLGGVKIGNGLSADAGGVISTVYNGTISGSGTTTQIPVFSGAETVTSTSDFSFNGLSLYLNGSILATGDITAFYTSDARLKENVTKITNALEKVDSLQGVTFTWNTIAKDMMDPLIDRSNTEAGVIAQEVLGVLPEAVKRRDNGYYAVNYDKIIPLLIEAIKELKAEVEVLKSAK